jgi:hypothetical protein
MVRDEKEKATKINEKQTTLLLFMFIKLNAHLWEAEEHMNKGFKKSMYAFCLNQGDLANCDILSTLKLSQVETQYKKFLLDIALRKKLGHEYNVITLKLIDDEGPTNFGNIFIVEILINVRKHTKNLHPRLNSLLPKLFHQFVERVLDHYENKSIPLTDEDQLDLFRLSYYTKKVLLSFYNNLWLNLSKIENGDLKKPNVDINQMINGLELELCRARQDLIYKGSNNTTNTIFSCFFKKTILHQSFESTKVTDLYPDYDLEMPGPIYPDMIQLLAINSCNEESKEPLKRFIFWLFESSAYAAYCKSIGLMYAINNEFIDTNINDKIDENDNAENNITLSETKPIIYYIACATLRKMVGILIKHNDYNEEESTTIIETLQNNLLLTLEQARILDLPISRNIEHCKTGNDKSFYFINEHLFQMMLHLENDILSVWFSNVMLLLVLRHDFKQTIWSYITNSYSYEALVEYISVILSSSEKVSKFLPDMIGTNVTNPKFTKLVYELVNKFFEYYLNVALKDFNTKVLPKVESKKKTVNNNNVPWRLLLQLSNVDKDN